MARHTHFCCECSYKSPGKLEAINIFTVKKVQLVYLDELLSLRFQWRADTQATRFREPCLCEKFKPRWSLSAGLMGPLSLQIIVSSTQVTLGWKQALGCCRLRCLSALPVCSLPCGSWEHTEVENKIKAVPDNYFPWKASGS